MNTEIYVGFFFIIIIILRIGLEDENIFIWIHKIGIGKILHKYNIDIDEFCHALLTICDIRAHNTDNIFSLDILKPWVK